MNIMERLDKLREKIQDPKFFSGEGLGGEVNIYIFRYSPKDEMAIRNFTEQLQSDKTLHCNIIEKNLYKIFLDICEKEEILIQLPVVEEEDGKHFILEQIHQIIDGNAFAKEIEIEKIKSGDVLLLTHVGEVFPFIRVCDVLNALQTKNKSPVVVLYPGNYNSRELKLFNKIESTGYYRAFNIIERGKI